MAQILPRIAEPASTAVATYNCFRRSNSQIKAASSWYACNNSRAIEDGAQVCCMAKEQCGPDSICMVKNNFYVGGCTDATYGDPVCRTSCTHDAQRWIEWNTTAQVWGCCGDDGCGGHPTPTETFTAVASASWSPIEWEQKSPTASSAASTETTASSLTSTSQASTSIVTTPSPTSNGNDRTSSLSTGAQAGIGVACGLLGLAAILALALLVMKRQKKRRANRSGLQKESAISGSPDFSNDQGGAPMMAQKYVPLGELDAQQTKQEMPAGRVDPVELENSEHARGLR